MQRARQARQVSRVILQLAVIHLPSWPTTGTVDTGDDPLWADALASPDREYWIAGAREEIQSLKDLQVYVLIPTGRSLALQT